ncbi:MAG: hypothetical protein Q9178_004730 [Gyalolechia marmorata]
MDVGDPNLILTVRADDLYAANCLSTYQERCPSPYPDGIGNPSRDATPGSEQDNHLPEFQLRFDQRPKDLNKGFVFGTDPLHCDVQLPSTIGHGKNRYRNKISGQHFRITFDNQGRLVLEDTSTWGTAVSYDDQARDEIRSRPFTWILFPNWKIKVCLLKEVCVFELHLAKHEGCQAEYNANLSLYMADKQDPPLPLETFGLDSYQSTAQPSQSLTPRKDPIYIFGRLLGKGISGAVKYTLDVSTGQEYAAKSFHPGSKFEVEVEILKSISHEHIVQFVHFVDIPTPLLVLEYLPLGDLHAQHSSSQILVEEIIVLFHQMLQALAYIHTYGQGYAHRDIKPANILILSRMPCFHAKLADFGFAKDRSALVSCVGSYAYSAPEIWTRAAYTEVVDIWSLGVVIFEFAYGLPEYGGTFKPEQRYQKLIRTVREWDQDDLIDLLSGKVLKEHPQHRLSANDLLTEVSKLKSGTISFPPRQLCQESPEVSTQIWDPASDGRREGRQRSAGGHHGSNESSYLRRSKRHCIGRMDDKDQPTDLRHSERPGTPQPEIGSSSQHPEAEDGFLRLALGEHFVMIRMRDFRINGTQILKVAGQGREIMTQFRKMGLPFDIVRGHAFYQGTYVDFNVGLQFCQRFGLDELEGLLRDVQKQHSFYTSFTWVLPSIQQTVSDQYFTLTDGQNHSIFVRAADDTVNIFRILKAAGYDRKGRQRILDRTKPWCIKYEAISAAPLAFRGTYIDMPATLRICGELGLDYVKHLAQQHKQRQEPSNTHTMIAKSSREAGVEPTVPLNSSLNPSQNRERQSTDTRTDPTPHSFSSPKDSIVTPPQCSAKGQSLITAPTDTDFDSDGADSHAEEVRAIRMSTSSNLFSGSSSFIPSGGSILQQPIQPEVEQGKNIPKSPDNVTEPSFSQGSFLPPTGRSFLQSVHPSLRPEPGQSSSRFESATESFEREHRPTGDDFGQISDFFQNS